MTEEGLLQVWIVDERDKRRLYGEIDMRVVKLTPETVNYRERVESRGQRCSLSQREYRATGTTNRPGWINEQINTNRELG